jgi:hypothetical protein
MVIQHHNAGRTDVLLTQPPSSVTEARRDIWMSRTCDGLQAFLPRWLQPAFPVMPSGPGGHHRSRYRRASDRSSRDHAMHKWIERSLLVTCPCNPNNILLLDTQPQPPVYRLPLLHAPFICPALEIEYLFFTPLLSLPALGPYFHHSRPTQPLPLTLPFMSCQPYYSPTHP